MFPKLRFMEPERIGLVDTGDPVRFTIMPPFSRIVIIGIKKRTGLHS
jgi:hypothetical protein